MIDNQPDQKKADNSLLWKYAGFATQLTVALAISVYAGMKLDSFHAGALGVRCVRCRRGSVVVVGPKPLRGRRARFLR